MYPGPVEIVAFKMQFSQQVVLITFLITEINESILLPLSRVQSLKHVGL